ncbi:ABC transporter ATP-binding protein [Terrisporobacter vanillatitrophus]|uniref:ABC transporter ATP-binding protein n=1 Tax=Terrisporobacter vanillatitrophus TaxID=3058402 RepID=UPI003368E25A
MSLKLENLKVNIGENEILHNINLNINSGEFISLLGPSGCGKSTLLKTIAGLNDLQEGKIILFGNEIQNISPEKRGTVIVFQDLRLFPHLSVEKNIAFAMNLNKVNKQKQKEVVSKLLKDVQLEGFENRKIKELSGGQMQRVALARALAANPNILLLDEPFSGLDEKLRLEMGQLVKKLQRENNMTMILVTHDKNEALQLSDRIGLMMHGDIIQYDKPYNIYTEPISKKVADYFGKNNYFVGKVESNIFKCDDFQFNCDKKDGKYEIMVRPSSIEIDEKKESYEISEITYIGDFIDVILSNNNKKILVKSSAKILSNNYIKINNKVGIKIREEEVSFFKFE